MGEENLKKTENVQYFVEESKVESTERGSYLTYGIRAVAAGRSADRIADISTDRGFVEMLAERCNRLSVSLLHFRDVIEDAVAFNL